MKIRIKQTLIEGFNILKRNPKIFVPALIIALLSAYLSYILISFGTSIASVISPQAPLNIETTLSIIFEALRVIVPLVIASLLVGVFMNGMIIRMAYDSKRGKPSLSKSARLVASKYVTLLIASIVSGVIVMLGFIALFIPGIFLGVKLLFVQYSILIDNKGVISSLKNSWKFTKGNWWGVFILMVVFSAASMIVSRVVEISNFIFYPISFFILIVITSLIISPWQLASFTLAYLQLRK